MKEVSNVVIVDLRFHWCMLFRGTERNQRGIFRKMLKRGTIVSTTEINMVADLWKALGGYSPLLLLANYSVHYMNMILKVYEVKV